MWPGNNAMDHMRDGRKDAPHGAILHEEWDNEKVQTWE